MHLGSLLKKNQRLKALKEDDPEYKRVKELFEEGWLHPNKPLPAIRTIFKLLKTSDEMCDYRLYNSNIEAEVGGGVVVSGLFFHGTNRACTLGDTRTNNELCNKKECNTCDYPWLIRCWQDRFSRFGPGIYTSACSSKADDYFKNVISPSKVQSRVLLLNAVVYGNPHKLYHTDASAGSLSRIQERGDSAYLFDYLWTARKRGEVEKAQVTTAKVRWQGVDILTHRPYVHVDMYINHSHH
ncbi:hypothetical protein BDM02DRAFT_1355740 [Thelephora ganbajun]|uniref:Uncharacterized protein n=1 Tax=Thelephora ganbajun TaxID=370292 RepID=A0ACB6Z2N6_THEGA|nr:hypothetical protein BDM02DRAFT_1355740 [Thelephora ganbajun]